MFWARKKNSIWENINVTFSIFRWTIPFRFDRKLWSSLVMWLTRQDGFRSVLVRRSSSKKHCATNVWQQWRSKIERVAPEVSVLLIFPLRGKGAENVNIRYGVEISFYCLALTSAGEMDLKYLASTYFTRLNWSKSLFDGTRIACMSWNDPMLVP